MFSGSSPQIIPLRCWGATWHAFSNPPWQGYKSAGSNSSHVSQVASCFERSPQTETHSGVKTIYWLLGLSGAALVTSWLWPSPFWIIILFCLFPFSLNLLAVEVLYSHTVSTTLALAVCYGAFELIIALGMWRMRDWSRKALLGLSGLWVLYGILATVALQRGFYGAPIYYYAVPIAVVYAVMGAALIFYMRRQKVREYFSE
jgi:hypothetical protein